MKRVRIFVLLPFLLIMLEGIQAQCINGTLSYPLYKDGATIVKQIDDQGDEIVHIEYDLLFTSKETFRTLTSDWTYNIVAFADGGIKDLDVKVYVYDDMLESWTQVVEDNATEAYSMVTVTPTATAQYKIEVIAYTFNEGYTAARYGLIIYHD